VIRGLYFALGCIFLVIGIVGYILPFLPGTINLILAAGFFAKSSPRLETWMLEHPHFGPTLKSWRQEGSISAKHKAIAITMLWIGMVFPIVKAPWYVGLGCGLIGVGVTLYLLTRPTRTAAAAA